MSVDAERARWHRRMAAQAEGFAYNARERGAHDLAELYECDSLRHRQSAERIEGEMRWLAHCRSLDLTHPEPDGR